MVRIIKPRRVHSWRRLLDRRFASSVHEDQFCLKCSIPGDDPDCPACGGSGLVVPAGPDGLRYPSVPWMWVAGDAVDCVVTFWSLNDGNVLGLVLEGRVVLGLISMSEEAQGQLQAAYRSAFGEDAGEVEFVLPRSI